METTKFVRKPFMVDAVEVTAENMAEIAEMVGTLREDDNGIPYIFVDRRLVPNIYRVYAGFWMTQMGDHIRCYSRKIFRAQFVESNRDIENLVWMINKNDVDAKKTTNVFDVKVSSQT